MCIKKCIAWIKQVPVGLKSAFLGFKEKTVGLSPKDKILLVVKPAGKAALGFIKNLWDKAVGSTRKTKIIALIVVLVLAVAGGGAIWYFKFRVPPVPPTPQELAKREREKIRAEEDKLLFKGDKPVVVPKLSNKETVTAQTGGLEIKFHNFKEFEVQTLELDSNYNRVKKNVLAVQIEVFNPSAEKTETLVVGLTDDKGNKYRPDTSIAFYVMNERFFGLNMNIYPRIMQDGFLYYTDIDPEAKKFKLLFATKSTGSKTAFEFERVSK